MLLVTIIAGLLCFAYLSINTYFTGHATGTFRYPAPELIILV